MSRVYTFITTICVYTKIYSVMDIVLELYLNVVFEVNM